MSDLGLKDIFHKNQNAIRANAMRAIKVFVTGEIIACIKLVYEDR